MGNLYWMYFTLQIESIYTGIDYHNLAKFETSFQNIAQYKFSEDKL